MNKINIAVAGCGDIAHIRYFNALSQLTDKYQLVGVHDMKPEVVKRPQRSFM